MVSYWVQFNHCSLSPIFTNVPNISTSDNCTAEHYVYSGGDAGSSVELYKVISGRLLYEAMPVRPYDDQAIGRRRLMNRVDPLPAIYRRRLRAVDRSNLRSAGAVVVNSRYMAGTIREVYGVDAQVSYLGVDTRHFRPLGLERRRFVLSVGSLTPLKGFDFLVQALATCSPRHRLPLVIVSNFQNPPERAYLEGLARERQVELVLVGQATEEDLVRLYNEASAVAYAPVREPFGLVPLEAMACGTPVVGVAEGGIPESVIDGRTGLLTDRHPERFGAAIARLVAQLGELGAVGLVGAGRQAVLLGAFHPADVVVIRAPAFGAGIPPNPCFRFLGEEVALIESQLQIVMDGAVRGGLRLD
jgi:glycosyltransferase involved in cell wall biosynthesis